MSSFLMRFTPRKTGVVLHGEPTFATSSSSSEQQHQEPTKKEDEQQMLETQNSSSSVSVSSTSKKQEQEQAAVAAASSSKHKQYYRGMEIISLPSCSIPEPTISIAGHAFLVLVWWSAFIIFGALTVFVFFFDHQNSQSVALPTMLSQDPVVPVRFAITCVETSNSWTEGELIQSNRTITSKLHMKYSSTSSCASKSTVLTQEMSKDKTSSTTNSSTFTFSSNSLVGSLCFERDQPFSALPANPDIFGMYLELTSDKIDGVTSTPQCYVDFESSMVPPEQEKNSGTASASSNSTTPTTNFYRLRRMNVETLAVRVLTVGHYTKYFTTDRHKDVVELRDQYIYPQVYDLEGQRGSWGLENENLGAILVVKFLNTAIVVTENDPRTFFNFVGWFGSWWRSTDLFLFWIFPVVCTFFARNFLEDSQTGKVDGYTKDLLADAWKPLFSLWIAEVLMRSIGQLMKGGKA